jgi:coatomer protein complex subunit gamma
MVSFLSGVLRDEKGNDPKPAVVEAIFDRIQFTEDCEKAALAHLCQSIEDCKFTKLGARILYFPGVK